MSEENVETIRRMYEAFGRRDFDDAAQYLHRDFELYPGHYGARWKSHYRGPGGIKEFWEVITEVWKTVTVEFKETIEAPDNRIVSVERWRSGRKGWNRDRYRGNRCLRIPGLH